MGTINNSGSGAPLINPNQLKQLQNSQPAKTDSTHVLGNQSVSQLLTPDQLKQQNNGKVGALPSLSLYNRPSTQPTAPVGSLPKVQPAQQPAARPTINDMASQLKGLMKSADSQILSQFSVQVQKDAAGNISKDAQGNVNYMVNGKAVSHSELQRHLLPKASILHSHLVQAQQYVENQYQTFVGVLNQNFAKMSPTEQTSMQIQLKAIQAVHQGFLDRINQVDRLIR